MGTDQDTVGELRTIAGGDIRGLQGGAVETAHSGKLGGDGKTVDGKLLLDPSATGIVGIAVHHTGSEGTLAFAEQIGTIGIEHGAYGCERDAIIGYGSLFAETAGSEKHQR